MIDKEFQKFNIQSEVSGPELIMAEVNVHALFPGHDLSLIIPHEGLTFINVFIQPNFKNTLIQQAILANSCRKQVHNWNPQKMKFIVNFSNFQYFWCINF